MTKFAFMIQTPKAIVYKKGRIMLPTEIRLEKSRPALITIFDEEANLPREV